VAPKQQQSGRVCIGEDPRAHVARESAVLCSELPLASYTGDMISPAPKGAPLCEACERKLEKLRDVAPSHHTKPAVIAQHCKRCGRQLVNGACPVCEAPPD